MIPQYLHPNQAIPNYSSSQNLNPNNFNILNNNPPKWHLANTIDWNFVNKLNPYLIKKSKDIDSLQNLITFLNKVEISPDDQATFNHPLTPKLFQLCQVLVDYLIYCQNNLSERLETKLKENEKFKRKIKSLENSNQKMQIAYRRLSDAYKQANVVIDKLKIPREACPVCGKKFMEGGYLDKHFELKHKDLCVYWSAIRTQQPINVANKEIKELIDQIKELKEQTAEQKKKYENAKRKISRQEIEKEDPLESTLEELNDQFHEACDSLDSSVQLYQKQYKQKHQKVINTANPFALFKHANQDFDDNIYLNRSCGFNQPEQSQMFEQNNKPEIQINQTSSIEPKQFQPVTQQELQMKPQLHMQEPIQMSIVPQMDEAVICNNQQNSHKQSNHSPKNQSSQKIVIEKHNPQQIQQFEEQQAVVPKHLNQQAVLMAKNFLNPEYRQSKYKISEDRMEQMISQVSSRIQNEISNVSNQNKIDLDNSVITEKQFKQTNSELTIPAKIQNIDKKPAEIQNINNSIKKKQINVQQSINHDEEFSYNEDSDSYSTPFMEEVNQFKQISTSPKSTKPKTVMQNSNKTPNNNIQSGPVVTKPKRVIHIPEEPQKPVEIYIKSIDNVEIKQPTNNHSAANEESTNPFEIDSSFQSAAGQFPCQNRKELPNDNKYKKNTTSITSNKEVSSRINEAYEESNQIKQMETKITNSELDELLLYSESNSGKPQKKKKENSSKPTKNVKPRSPNHKSPVQSPRREAPIQSSLQNSSKQEPFEKKDNGITITNSELNELLRESDDNLDLQNSKQLSKSAIDTFYQGNINEIDNEDFSSNENFNDQRISQLKELPKPPKRIVSTRKFDFSFLNQSNA